MADSKIKIIIRVSEDQTFEVEIAKTATVKELKQQCADNQGTPIEDIKLIFKGRILKDESTVAESNLE